VAILSESSFVRGLTIMSEGDGKGGSGLRISRRTAQMKLGDMLNGDQRDHLFCALEKAGGGGPLGTWRQDGPKRAEKSVGVASTGIRSLLDATRKPKQNILERNTVPDQQR